METVPNPESVAKEADGACKKEEEAPVIETAYQKRLEEEKVWHEHEQQIEVELFGQSHDHDIQEKHCYPVCWSTRESFLMEAYTCVYVVYIDITLLSSPFVNYCGLPASFIWAYLVLSARVQKLSKTFFSLLMLLFLTKWSDGLHWCWRRSG
ncbi:hypothetical protein Droror1_Dr00009189 [Drosera rotundifolia]